MSIIDSLKKGISYTSLAANEVNIKVGQGNSQILVKGNNVDISAGVGNQKIVVLGNDVDIELDQSTGSFWDSDLDFDTVAVISNKGKVDIDTGDGNDTAIVLADDVNITMGDGQHLIGFWGDDVKIDIGDGSNNIYTMDKMATAGILDESTTIAGVNVGKRISDALEADTVLQSETLYDITSKEGTNKTDFLNKMKSTYNLDTTNMSKLEELYDSGDLFKEYKSGVPAYAIIQSVTQKNADGTAKYVIAMIDGQNSDGYFHTRGLKNGSFCECIATKKGTVSSYTEQETITREVATRDVFILSGTKNLEINVGSGQNNDIDVTSTGKVEIITGDYSKLNKINVDGEIKVYGDVEISKDISKSNARKISFSTNIESTYTSPIIVDFNRDGKVSAIDGKGVDVDGNGVVDGAATGGDKMLAMSDNSKNGVIDGSEVFGDKTLSPFTGLPLNAANGFEALRIVATEAEKYTGISCIKDGMVNLHLLKAALNTVGVNLGFISENNVTELEDLAHVTSINVSEYEEFDEQGNVQHRQQGSYVDFNGETYGANDVWFRNRSLLEGMIDKIN